MEQCIFNVFKSAYIIGLLERNPGAEYNLNSKKNVYYSNAKMTIQDLIVALIMNGLATVSESRPSRLHLPACGMRTSSRMWMLTSRRA